jgi:hypothetical protein
VPAGGSDPAAYLSGRDPLCFPGTLHSGLGKQQVAILANEPAQAAWSESWKSTDGVNPLRGFTFAWFRSVASTWVYLLAKLFEF